MTLSQQSGAIGLITFIKKISTDYSNKKNSKTIGLTYIDKLLKASESNMNLFVFNYLLLMKYH